MDGYTRGIERSIARNRRTGAARKREAWMTPEREQLIRDLNQYGMRDGRADGFMCSMLDAIEQWGALTEKQEQAAIKSIERAKQRDTERQAKRDEFSRNNAESQWVGTIGERNVWVGTVLKKFKFDGQFGPFNLTILRDVHGNIFVINDNKDQAPDVGRDVMFRGTIRKHGERDGVKQTVFNRVVISGEVK